MSESAPSKKEGSKVVQAVVPDFDKALPREPMFFHFAPKDSTNSQETIENSNDVFWIDDIVKTGFAYYFTDDERSHNKPVYFLAATNFSGFDYEMHELMRAQNAKMQKPGELHFSSKFKRALSAESSLRNLSQKTILNNVIEKVAEEQGSVNVLQKLFSSNKRGALEKLEAFLETYKLNGGPWKKMSVFKLSEDDLNQKLVVYLRKNKKDEVAKPVNVSPQSENKPEKTNFPRPDSWHGVVGQETAVSELKKITAQLSRVDEFRRYGTSVEQGILLYGPPGVGKTSLADGLARAIGAKVVEIDCNVFSKWVHETEENLIRKFSEAAQISKKGERVLIILNEVNAVAPKRSDDSSSGYRENQTETFLVTLEKTLKENPGIVVVGTTNNRDKVDSAAQRPGRLGLKISCDLPQTEKEVSDLVAFGLYGLLDEANKYRSSKEEAKLNISDIISLDKENMDRIHEIASRLINYPQATIIKGVEKAMRTKIDKGGKTVTPLTAEEIYAGILEYSVTPIKEQDKGGDLFVKVK